ncbi:MAG: hypothetical protein J6C96_06660 [Oscillospiraceae bacterium]|nr:hypothetical protein [Oscillospiraceae bacterium]
MTYLNMLLEYKQSEKALRNRIAEITDMLKKSDETMERDALIRRKAMLQQELYDLLDVIDELYEYCGVNGNCRNA